MTEELGKISDIADRIVLDDISDIFYRSIVFPFIMRTELDCTSDTTEVFDQRLQKKLGRLLYWADALITFDPQVKRLCNIASHFYNNQYTAELLKKDRQEDFWFDKALNDVFANQVSKPSQASKSTRATEANDPKSDANTGDTGIEASAYKLRQVAWLYIQNNTPEPCLSIMQRVQTLTLEYRDAARFLAKEEQVTINDESLESISLLHALPMLILLKLYGHSLFKLRVEFNQKYNDEYEPTAESILDFLKFDEFIRPHIMESMGIDAHHSPTLLHFSNENNIEQTYFLRGRNHVIKKLLVGNHVLTPLQVSKLEQQMGIEHEVEDGQANSSFNMIMTKLFRRHNS